MDSQRPMKLQRHGTGALEESAKKRKAILDDSSVKNRNLFVGFLGVQLYTLVMTLAVSDEDLLLGRMAMRIPLVDLGLPPVAWFSVVPVLLFILHVDVLHNLREHLDKLVAWRDACGGRLDRREMQPFFYDFAFAYGRAGWMGKVLDEAVWLMVYFLPLFTLLVVQVRFGAYQNPLVTSLHALLLVGDAGMCIKLYPDWQNALATAEAPKLWPARLNRPWLRTLLTSAVFVVLWLLLSGRWDGGVTSHVAGPRPWYQQPPSSAWTLTGLLIVAAGLWLRPVCYLVLLCAALAYGGLAAWFISGWRLDVAKDFVYHVDGSYLEHTLPRLVVPGRLLISVEEGEKRALEMLADHQAAQPNAAQADSDFQRRRAVAEQWWQQGSRSDWRGRSFNLAELAGSNLARADLRGARLQWARLSGAQLQGARLDNAQLQGANLVETQLQGVSLDNAQLQGALLGNAQLQGASLGNAQLQEARLGNAQLQGASLVYAQLQGASLDHAQLQGTRLVYAQLQGASLIYAQLQGAGLGRAQLQGASLFGAQFQGSTCDFSFRKIGLNGLKQGQDHADEFDACRHDGAFGPLAQAEADKIRPFLSGYGKDDLRKRVGQPASLDQAVCGTLTPAMVQAIAEHWNDQVPSEITEQWAKQGHPCAPP